MPRTADQLSRSQAGRSGKPAQAQQHGNDHERARSDEQRERTSYDVRLKKKALSQAQRIAQRLGDATEGDAVRRALAVLDFIGEETENGAVFRLERPDGKIERIQFVFG